MIPLAASNGGQYVFLIVFAIVGVVNWWMEKQKQKKNESQSAPPPRSAPERMDATGGGDPSEQERLRRFLEALGVPQQPQQPRQAQPQQAAPNPAKGNLPQQARRQVAQQKQAKKTPRQVVRQPKPVVVEKEEFVAAGRLEEPASSIEGIAGEFGKMNVRVEMPSMSMPKASANAGTTSVQERSGNPLVASLRHTLTNPTSIRAAFLAAELLGPPKGLQK
jgi:hypothetical protein